MNDLISIVLPVYNGAKYLQESIDSVLAQTYRNWELLIVDDCSVDETPTIARKYVELDSRVKYFRNEENLRLPRNLTKGFSLTTGAYLTWTSDDNRYHPEALERMYQALQKNPQAQLVYTSFNVINENDDLVETYIAKSPRLLVGFNVVGACFLYTRKVYETVGNYDHEMILVEDYDYWQRVAQHFDIIAITDVLYDYRRHSGALSSTMRKDTFHKNLEKLLLKYYKGFGRLDLLQKYHLYRGLYTCRKDREDKENPYTLRFIPLHLWYFCRYQAPAILKRKWQRYKVKGD